jgi:coenzyme F420-reducing hydrogenase alpha subunit
MEPINVILKPNIIMKKKIKTQVKKPKEDVHSTQELITEIKESHSTELNNENKTDYTMTDEDFYSLLEDTLHYIDNNCIQYLSYPNYESRVEEELWNYLYIILPNDAIDDNKDILESLVNYSIEHYFTIMCKERSFNRELFFEIPR